ncbi:MAG: hypothetical protein ACTSYT_05545 [Candidatus Asgardarchaeia archaeon]
MDGLIYVFGIVGFSFVIFFIIGLQMYKTKERVYEVIDVITDYLEKGIINVVFSLDDVEKRMRSKGSKLTRAQIQKILNKLVEKGLLLKEKRTYSFKEPLVFLTRQDYLAARRYLIGRRVGSRGNTIIYGAYQNPYLRRMYLLLLLYLIFVIDMAFVAVVYFNLYPPLTDWLIANIVRSESLLPPFLLFLIAFGIVLVDAVDNIIKSIARESYKVIVTDFGVYYDVKFGDEFSGEIRRGELRRAYIDINTTTLQKILNYFIDPPVGDVVIKVGGRKIAFKSIPYPRELKQILTEKKLEGFRWSKRNAKTLMLWRMGRSTSASIAIKP